MLGYQSLGSTKLLGYAVSSKLAKKGFSPLHGEVEEFVE
jgi:hypothetical protein